MVTFSSVLAHSVSVDPGRPLVTFYDDATGERVELSATTYANWVAKTASLLCEEHDLARGDRLRVDLPPHWLGAVVLGAAWTAGLVLTDATDPADVDAVVCGPDGLARWSALAADVPVLACSLLPLGVRFAEPLPAHVHDVGVEVWGQPDAFTPVDPPQAEDPALELGGEVLTQAAVCAAAAAGALLGEGGRLLTDTDPSTPPGSTAFGEALARGGSVVLVTGAAATRLDAVADVERCTARLVGGS